MMTAAMVVAVAAVAVVVMYLVFRSGPGATHSAGTGSGYPHVAGDPKAGTAAPPFTLTSGAGKPVSLSDYRGRTVLLYFQEGLSCQPCWDQIGDLEHNQAALRAAGVDAVVSITTDRADLIGRKAADEKLTTPVLSDPDLAVSRTYDANQYGMMGDMRDGHSFVLVGPDGVIRWRADYGGAPQSAHSDRTGADHPAHPTLVRDVRTRQRNPRPPRRRVSAVDHRNRPGQR
jgi:peroxiredoxin Q/BCP